MPVGNPSSRGGRRTAPVSRSVTRKLPAKSAMARLTAVGGERHRLDGLAEAAQRRPHPPPGRDVAHLHGAVLARHAERTAIGTELDREHLAVLDPRQVAQPAQAARVVQSHATVREPGGDRPAGGADRERRRRELAQARRMGRACLERVCEAAVSRDVPHDDPPVEPAGVERPAVVGDHERW